MMDQFFIIAAAHLLAVISPVPDFILISRQSFLYGRVSAIYTSIGIAFGILFHVIYCILGLGYILSEFNEIIFFLKLSCSFYLFYLGITSIFVSAKSNHLINKNKALKNNTISIFNSFKIGFVTNLLNIKATLFFLSLYSFMLTSNPNSSLSFQMFCGLWMIVVTGLWFIFVSIFFTNNIFKNTIEKHYLLINRIMGILIIYIAFKLIVS